MEGRRGAIGARERSRARGGREEKRDGAEETERSGAGEEEELEERCKGRD